MDSSVPSFSKSGSHIQPQGLGDNLTISGGQFNQVQNGQFSQHNDNSVTNNNNITTYVNASLRDGFERLQREVSCAAFHNSSQRVDPPRCHPKTREAVMTAIVEWIRRNNHDDSWILWLNGAAGAGKSAIAQSIAELCVEHGLVIASFFCFRTDPTRNTTHPLVSTLAYQIARSIPATRGLIVQAMEADPMVFQQSVEYQLERLIVQPLRWVGCLSNYSGISPPVLLIDGLDECQDRNAQTALVRTLSDISANGDPPLLFLITSRPEPHLAMVFNSKKVAKSLTRVTLDNKYLPDTDIRLFINDKFAEIHDAHPLNHFLDIDWPRLSLVDEILGKASGQFIYAAVVMKYVSSPRAHPAQRLEVIRGLRTAHLDSPFAQLDALYRFIFSEVSDIEVTLLIVAIVIFGVSRIETIRAYLELEEGSVEACLSDLASLIICEEGKVKFLHASLPDFLCDKARSQKYYINPSIWCTYLSQLWFEHAKIRAGLTIKLTQKSDSIKNVIGFLKYAEPSPGLHADLMEFTPTWNNLPHVGVFDPREISAFLSAIKALDFHDAYSHQLLEIIRFFKTDSSRFARVLDQLAYLHDISGPLAQIALEETQKRENAPKESLADDGKEITSAKEGWVAGWIKEYFSLGNG